MKNGHLDTEKTRLLWVPFRRWVVKEVCIGLLGVGCGFQHAEYEVIGELNKIWTEGDSCHARNAYWFPSTCLYLYIYRYLTHSRRHLGPASYIRLSSCADMADDAPSPQGTRGFH